MFGLSHDTVCDSEEIDEQTETNDDGDINNTDENDVDDDDDNNDNDNFNNTVDCEEISDQLEILLPKHLKCASHTLNLIASSDAIKIINNNARLKRTHEETIEECKKLWKKLRSPKNREALNKYLKCALKRPIVTRWNSLYNCLKQILALQNKLTDVDIQHLNFEVNFKEHHFIYIKDYITCMEPLALGIEQAQAEKNIYYGCLLPLLISINNKWTALLRNNNLIYCTKLVEEMQLRLHERFNDFFEIRGQGEAAALATITHPHFKDKWLACLDDEKKTKVQQLIVDVLSIPEDKSYENLEENMEIDDFYDLGENNEQIARRTQIFTFQGENTIEIIRFLNNPNSIIDSLKQFPQVKQLFIKFNTCIPSSAPVERLFSYATMINVGKFNKLSDDSFEKRVVAAANMKKKIFKCLCLASCMLH